MAMSMLTVPDCGIPVLLIPIITGPSLTAAAPVPAPGLAAAVLTPPCESRRVCSARRGAAAGSLLDADACSFADVADGASALLAFGRGLALVEAVIPGHHA
jgi:hypothetical protein